jgi:hypothetical protein
MQASRQQVLPPQLLPNYQVDVPRPCTSPVTAPLVQELKEQQMVRLARFHQ